MGCATSTDVICKPSFQDSSGFALETYQNSPGKACNKVFREMPECVVALVAVPDVGETAYLSMASSPRMSRRSSSIMSEVLRDAGLPPNHETTCGYMKKLDAFKRNLEKYPNALEVTIATLRAAMPKDAFDEEWCGALVLVSEASTSSGQTSSGYPSEASARSESKGSSLSL